MKVEGVRVRVRAEKFKSGRLVCRAVEDEMGRVLLQMGHSPEMLTP